MSVPNHFTSVIHKIHTCWNFSLETRRDLNPMVHSGDYGQPAFKTATRFHFNTELPLFPSQQELYQRSISWCTNLTPSMCTWQGIYTSTFYYYYFITLYKALLCGYISCSGCLQTQSCCSIGLIDYQPKDAAAHNWSWTLSSVSFMRWLSTFLSDAFFKKKNTGVLVFFLRSCIFDWAGSCSLQRHKLLSK